MNSLIEIKKQAKILKSFLSNQNQDISLSSCYQAIAKMNGYKDWNTMSAELENQADPTAVKKSEFIGDHVEIAETALLTIVNKGSSGKLLDEDAIRLLLFFLYKLENNSILVNENQAYFLFKNDRFNRALDVLIEEKFIFRTYYEEYCTYEINPNYFWKGTSYNHKAAINNLCKNTLVAEAEAYEQPGLQELQSLFESRLKEKQIEFAKEVFSPNDN